eukprot:GABV01007204.1.p2 GENE.GABV01007204.1~~GABV01007204.1.p2  ORF type:complete len:101 (-),score=21.85 GABV01007204.1:11-313(-)
MVSLPGGSPFPCSDAYGSPELCDDSNVASCCACNGGGGGGQSCLSEFMEIEFQGTFIRCSDVASDPGLYCQPGQVTAQCCACGNGGCWEDASPIDFNHDH